jgi:hypothetical protein
MCTKDDMSIGRLNILIVKRNNESYEETIIVEETKKNLRPNN